MKTETYTITREGYGQRGLQALLEEANVPLSNITSFTDKAVQVALTPQEVDAIEKKDDVAVVLSQPGGRLRAPKFCPA